MDSIILFFEKRLSFRDDKVLRVFCVGFSLRERSFFCKKWTLFSEWIIPLKMMCRSVQIVASEWQGNDCLFDRKQEGEESLISKGESNHLEERIRRHLEERIVGHIESRVRSSSYQNEGEINHFKMRVLPSNNLKKSVSNLYESYRNERDCLWEICNETVCHHFEMTIRIFVSKWEVVCHIEEKGNPVISKREGGSHFKMIGLQLICTKSEMNLQGLSFRNESLPDNNLK